MHLATWEEETARDGRVRFVSNYNKCRENECQESSGFLGAAPKLLESKHLPEAQQVGGKTGICWCFLTMKRSAPDHFHTETQGSNESREADVANGHSRSKNAQVLGAEKARARQTQTFVRFAPKELARSSLCLPLCLVLRGMPSDPPLVRSVRSQGLTGKCCESPFALAPVQKISAIVFSSRFNRSLVGRGKEILSIFCSLSESPSNRLNKHSRRRKSDQIDRLLSIKFNRMTRETASRLDKELFQLPKEVLLVSCRY